VWGQPDPIAFIVGCVGEEKTRHDRWEGGGSVSRQLYPGAPECIASLGRHAYVWEIV